MTFGLAAMSLRGSGYACFVRGILLSGDPDMILEALAQTRERAPELCLLY